MGQGICPWCTVRRSTTCTDPWTTRCALVLAIHLAPLTRPSLVLQELVAKLTSRGFTDAKVDKTKDHVLIHLSTEESLIQVAWGGGEQCSAL